MHGNLKVIEKTPSKPFETLFNSLLASGIVPEKFLIAKVIPVYIS